MRARPRIALRAPWTGARILRLIAYGIRSDLCNLRVVAITVAHDAQSARCVRAAPHFSSAAAISPPCTRPPDAVHWLAYQRPLQRTLIALLVCSSQTNTPPAAGTRKITTPADRQARQASAPSRSKSLDRQGTDTAGTNRVGQGQECVDGARHPSGGRTARRPAAPRTAARRTRSPNGSTCRLPRHCPPSQKATQPNGITDDRLH